MCTRLAAQVIKFTSCLPVIDGSLRVLRLLPPLKLVAMIYAEILLKVTLKHQNSTNQSYHKKSFYSVFVLPVYNTTVFLFSVYDRTLLLLSVYNTTVLLLLFVYNTTVLVLPVYNTTVLLLLFVYNMTVLLLP